MTHEVLGVHDWIVLYALDSVGRLHVPQLGAQLRVDTPATVSRTLHLQSHAECSTRTTSVVIANTTVAKE